MKIFHFEQRKKVADMIFSLLIFLCNYETKNVLRKSMTVMIFSTPYLHFCLNLMVTNLFLVSILFSLHVLLFCTPNFLNAFFLFMECFFNHTS